MLSGLFCLYLQSCCVLFNGRTQNINVDVMKPYILADTQKNVNIISVKDNKEHISYNLHTYRSKNPLQLNVQHPLFPDSNQTVIVQSQYSSTLLLDVLTLSYLGAIIDLVSPSTINREYPRVFTIQPAKIPMISKQNYQSKDSHRWMLGVDFFFNSSNYNMYIDNAFFRGFSIGYNKFKSNQVYTTWLYNYKYGKNSFYTYDATYPYYYVKNYNVMIHSLSYLYCRRINFFEYGLGANGTYEKKIDENSNHTNLSYGLIAMGQFRIEKKFYITTDYRYNFIDASRGNEIKPRQIFSIGFCSKF